MICLLSFKASNAHQIHISLKIVQPNSPFSMSKSFRLSNTFYLLYSGLTVNISLAAPYIDKWDVLNVLGSITQQEADVHWMQGRSPLTTTNLLIITKAPSRSSSTQHSTSPGESLTARTFSCTHRIATSTAAAAGHQKIIVGDTVPRVEGSKEASTEYGFKTSHIGVHSCS